MSVYSSGTSILTTDDEIEQGIKDIQEHLKNYPGLRQQYSTRYLAIKLLEGDKDVERLINRLAIP